jgi:hypothetical protein
MYNSTAEFQLCVIDPVHNIGIRVATGALCINWLESLYVESGESPLSLQRNLILCSVWRRATHPSHPSYSVVFHRTNCYRYELHITVPWLMGMRFMTSFSVLTYACCILVPLDYRLFIIQPTCDLWPIKHKPGRMSALRHCWLLAEFLFAFQTTWQFTVTGHLFMIQLVIPSCMKGPVGSVNLTAFLWPNSVPCTNLFFIPVVSFSSVTFKQSPLQSLLSCTPDHTVTLEILHQVSVIHKAGKYVVFAPSFRHP